MKKVFSFSLLAVTALMLTSCGSENTDNVVVDTNTPIETIAQSAKVCEPFVKYLECSLEKAPEAQKAKHEKILKDTERRIENDNPAKVAQECASYIQVIQANPDKASVNGCVIEGAVAPQAEATNPQA